MADQDEGDVEGDEGCELGVFYEHPYFSPNHEMEGYSEVGHVESGEDVFEGVVDKGVVFAEFLDG